jgi:hypothetical protein
MYMDARGGVYCMRFMKSNDPIVIAFLQAIGVDTRHCVGFKIEGSVDQYLRVTEDRRVTIDEPTLGDDSPKS